MKAFQLAAVLLLVCIGSAEALTCNRCVPYRTGGSCTTRDERCISSFDVCGSVICPLPSCTLYFRRCMKTGDDIILRTLLNCQVYTCYTDRCN